MTILKFLNFLSQTPKLILALPTYLSGSFCMPRVSPFRRKIFPFAFQSRSWRGQHFVLSFPRNTMFENHRKSLIQRCERSELRLQTLYSVTRQVIFDWTKNWSKFKCDILSNFQTLWIVNGTFWGAYCVLHSISVSLFCLLITSSLRPWGNCQVYRKICRLGL